MKTQVTEATMTNNPTSYRAINSSNTKQNSHQTSENKSPFSAGEKHNHRQILTKRLRDANLDTKRFCQIHERKATYDHDHLYRSVDDVPTVNYGVKGLGELVIIDVDDWESIPIGLKKLINDKPTFTVQSPHADGKEGHYYYKCAEQVHQKSPTWGDVKTGAGLVVGPGSELESCGKTGHDCSLPGHGQYVIKEDLPIASIEREELPISDGNDEGKEQSSSTSRNPPQYELPEHDVELAELGNAILRDLESANTASHVQLMKLLEGGVGRYDAQLTKSDNNGKSIDRSGQENLALLFLYGTIQQVGNVEEDKRAERILYATFDHFMRENPETTDGQLRKWLERDENYHANRIGSVIRDFDRGEFVKFLNLNSSPADYRFRSGKCSGPNYNMARFAVDLLSGAWTNTPTDELVELAQTLYNIHVTKEQMEAVVVRGDHEGEGGQVVESIHPMQNRERFEVYPTKAELYEAVTEFGSNLSSEESLRKNVLDELKESGIVKHASNGKKHVYYSSSLPDPDGAYWVRLEGAEYEP